MKYAIAGVLLAAALAIGAPAHAETPPGTPLDYFPLAKGTTWTYSIKIGTVEPTALEMPQWPIGKMLMQQITRSRFMPLLLKGPKPASYVLSYRIAGPAPSQGPFRWPGVKVEVLKDTLMYFDDVKEVFFNVTENSAVNLVLTYDSSQSPNSGLGWGQDGYSIRGLLFGAKPFIERSFGEKSPDRLLYVGYEQVPGSRDYGLHFIRTVDAPAADNADPQVKKTALDEAFTEETWFVQGKGMVLLIQKHHGKVAMTWTLTNFSH